MVRPPVRPHGDYGCLRCQVAWRGERTCWVCGRDDAIVASYVLDLERREERVRSVYSTG